MHQSNVVGRWLRHRRRAQDLTQVQLAAQAGCALATLKKIETGARMPSPRLIARLAEALVLSDDEQAWLLGLLRTSSLDTLPAQAKPTAPPAASMPTVAPTSLLLPPGSLIGRSRDLAALRDRLTNPATRLVTVVGPGGVGKTRLALQLAAELQDAFADGIFVVDLAQIHEPTLVLLALARALGFAPGATPLATLTNGIGLRRLLLVLDNVEQVLTAAPSLAEVIAAAPHLTLLATSRAPLRLAVEQVYDLPPLDLPALADAHALDTYGSIQLFIQRAQAIQPEFVLTPEYGPLVAQICQRLDGLPLAIELAAAWISVLPPPVLLRRLDRRLALLTQGRRDLPARQQTLRATIDWSFRLLPPRARHLLARIGVFVGGASLDAVEQVCWTMEHGDLLPVLYALVEQSCVRQLPDLTGEPRFHMLETIREYALDQLAADDSEAELRSRHAHYYLALADSAVPQLRSPAQRHWLELLELEHDNLRTACAWLLESGRQLEALRLVGALHWFWDRRGYLHEGRTLIQQALATTSGIPDTDALRHARGWALVGAATLAFDQGDWAAAAASAEAATADFRPLGDHRGLTIALLRLAFVRGMADPARAADLLAEARIHATATNEPWFEGLASFVSAQTALFGTRDLLAARMHMLAATPALRASGDSYQIAHGHATTGILALAEGNLVSAREDLEQALSVARSLADTRSVALIGATTADVARCQGDYERAAELYSESLALYHQFGNHAEIPAILHNQGYVALGQGNAGARDLFTESLRRHQERGNHAGIAEGLAGLGAVAVTEGALARSARLFGAAEAVRVAHPGPIWPAEQFEVERHIGMLRAWLPASLLEEQWQAGAALSLEQAVAEALAPGAAPPYPAPKGSPGGLTPREHAVALLVARGASNRAIAATLVISERTAEHHVANILAKLDFSSRAQIAAWVVANQQTLGHT